MGKNSKLTVGGLILSLCNSENGTGLIISEATTAGKPIYFLNDAVFSNGKVLIFNINLNN
jgi:hypothetical protein